MSALTPSESRSFNLLYAKIECNSPFTKRERTRYDRLRAKFLGQPVPEAVPEEVLTADALIEGDEFRTSPRQRKNLTLFKVFNHVNDEAGHPMLRGKLMLIVAGCRQIILEPTAQVWPAKL